MSGKHFRLISAIILSMPLLLGSSGGNCAGPIEAGNVLILEGGGNVDRILVTNFYNGSVSLGPAGLTTDGAIEAITLQNWNPRYVPYLMSVDLDTGGLLEASWCAEDDASCELRGSWMRPAVHVQRDLNGLQLDHTVVTADLDFWRPEKSNSLRVYDFGECRAETQLNFSQPGLAFGYADNFIAQLRESGVFPEARMRFMDIRPFFRGHQARFAELIITPENYEELFILAGRTKRLRPLREIPRHHFRDGHHPMDGDYLRLTADFNAPRFNANRQATLPGTDYSEWLPGLPFPGYEDVRWCQNCNDARVAISAEVDIVILNWDAMAEHTGQIWLNFDARGTPNEIPPRPFVTDTCNVVDGSDYQYVGTAGDWVAWDSDNGDGFELPLGPNDSRRIRRLYVDSTNIEVHWESACTDLVNSGIENGIRDAYKYSLANGFLRRALEERMAVSAVGLGLVPLNGETTCMTDSACMLQAYFGGVPDWHNFICVPPVDVDSPANRVGTCAALPQLERVMMTPTQIVFTTADGPGGLYREQMEIAGQCETIPKVTLRSDTTGQVGNPTAYTALTGPVSSGFSRWTYTEDIGNELSDCLGNEEQSWGICYPDPYPQIRESFE